MHPLIWGSAMPYRADFGARYALAAARTIVGAGGQVLPDSAVIVNEGTIEWVGPRDGLPLLPVVDLPGGTLMPGFVDAHVHLALDAGSHPIGTMEERSGAELAALMVRNAGTLLMSGVTTARDLGAPASLATEVKKLLATGKAPGPRLAVAGRPLTSPGGHCAVMGATCTSAADLSRAIQAMAAEGVDWIKIMVTGGFMTVGSDPNRPQFTADLVAHAVTEAGRLGLPVAAHAHSPEGIEIAAAAGVRTVEHCTWFEQGALRFVEASAALLAGNGAAVCPTLSPNSCREDGKVPWSARKAHLTAMRALGVALITGTDAGIRNTPFDSYAASLLPLLDLGMSPLDIIETATSVTAEAIGLGATVGTIEPGKAADLVLVAGNPLGDLTRLAAIVLVVARGRAYPLIEEGPHGV
ncbi:amidohydrolase family protein [Nonomuraea sp. NPDC048881]|uniref:amidohydrolase family protein n=1 Tax=Nonomuraea sp. NPDC048881 TaxID=3155030 RepID=UPI003403A896